MSNPRHERFKNLQQTFIASMTKQKSQNHQTQNSAPVELSDSHMQKHSEALYNSSWGCVKATSEAA